MVTENKRLTRLFSAEWPVIRPGSMPRRGIASYKPTLLWNQSLYGQLRKRRGNIKEAVRAWEDNHSATLAGDSANRKALRRNQFGVSRPTRGTDAVE